MAEFRGDDGQDQFGQDSRDGIGFSFNRTGVREFIRANDEGVVTHRLFIYQNGSSPGQIEIDEADALGGHVPRLVPVWQVHNAPERRGRGPPPVDFVPQLARPRRGVGGGGGGGAGGGYGGGGAGGGYGRGGAGGGYGRGADGSPALSGPPELSGGRRGLGYRHRTRKNKN